MINPTIRGFNLENERGEIFELSNYNQTPQAKNPRGLGIKYSREYLDLGDRFLISSESTDMGNPGFEIACVDGRNGNLTAYDQAQEVINFMNSAKELKLNYFVPSRKDSSVIRREKYTAIVKVKSIDKSEISGGMLILDVELDKFTNWFKNMHSRYIIVRAGSVASKKYGYSYRHRYSKRKLSEVIVDNASPLKTPVKVIINGKAETPHISFKSMNSGEIYCQMKINRTIDTDAYFDIDSTSDSFSHEQVSTSDNTQRENVYWEVERSLNFNNKLWLEPGPTLIKYENFMDDSGSVVIIWGEEYEIV